LPIDGSAHRCLGRYRRFWLHHDSARFRAALRLLLYVGASA
jgi:hypothetical protein